jgi:hypothetical protein
VQEHHEQQEHHERKAPEHCRLPVVVPIIVDITQQLSCKPITFDCQVQAA